MWKGVAIVGTGRIIMCNVWCILFGMKFATNGNEMTAPGPTKLANAPLKLVLAQVRYTPLLTISRSIPAIQEALKKAGFPRYSRNDAQNIVFSPGAAPRFDAVERWDFLSRDKRTGVVLTPEFVTLLTNNYETFSNFSHQLEALFTVIAAEVDIEIVERLGIRYVDLVRLEAGENFSDYLKPGLVGFPFSEVPDIQVAPVISSTQTIAQLPNSVMSVRCLQANTGAFLPPDLLPSILHYELTLRPQEIVTILDFDHYTTTEELEFTPERLVANLDQLHRVANKTFRAALKPFAYEKWGGVAK